MSSPLNAPPQHQPLRFEQAVKYYDIIKTNRLKLITIGFIDMYNLEQLRMFVTAAELGSFSACARELGKVQSTVSQALANLEIDLNVELFDRSAKKPQLTLQGEHLLAYAKAVLQQTEELNIAVQSIEKSNETQLTIAIENALQTPKLSRLLAGFAEFFPATKLEILCVASPDIIALVERKRADLGVMFSDMAFKREVDLSFIGSIPFCAVCGPQHPLSKLHNVNIADLMLHRQMIIKGQDGGGLDQVPPISAHIWSSNSIHCIIEAMQHNIGWGYLPSHMVKEAISAGKLHLIDMRLDNKDWSPSMDLVTPKNTAMGPAVSWLINAFNHLLD